MLFVENVFQRGGFEMDCQSKFDLLQIKKEVTQ